MEKSAGHFPGFEDEDYEKAGAQIVDSKDELWSRGELILKVKELQEKEYSMLHEDQVISTFFHLTEAFEPEVCENLKKAKVTTIALEQLVREGNFRVAIVPMSEIAGWNAAIQMTWLLFGAPASLGVALANFSRIEQAIWRSR